MHHLVTGASGFIGRWLVRALLEQGHQVRVFGRSEKSFTDPLFNQVEKFYGDIANKDDVAKAVAGTDFVFHLAGLIAYTKNKYQEMILANVIGTQNIVDACIEHKVKKLIHMSSVVAVGASFDKKPLSESSEYNISHLNLGYFETKRQAEQIVLDAAKSGKLFALCINPSTVYGPGDAEKGSRKTQIKVARGKFPFYTGGGVNVVHVDDLIKAVLKASEIGRSGERYIIAGENISIKQLFQMIADEAGVSAPWIKLPDWLIHMIGKYGGENGPVNSETAWTTTLYHWFDASKAKSELGLNPRPARKAIHDSVQWMKEQGLLQ